MPDATALTMDVITRPGPALSATSDMPVASPAPAAAEPAAAPAAPAAAPAESPAAAPPPADEAKDQTPAWMKAEITKERNRRRDAENARVEAERKAAEAQARLDEALARIPKPADAPAPAPADPRPQRDAFEDPQAYDDALIEWSTRQASVKAREEAAAQAAAEAQAAADAARKETEAAQVTEMQTKWGEARAKAIERMPDYEAVAENPEVQISMAMASVITSRPDGTDIAYHLGKNPELSARLAALPPPQAVFEMGLLAAQLQAAAPPAAQITKAPDPVSKPLGSRSSATPKGPQEESMEEYAARRTKELQAGKTRH